MDEITLDRFAEELREIAAEDPDRRNPLSDPDDPNAGCAYRKISEDGSVSRCIIGEWLHRNGHETHENLEGMAADFVLRHFGIRDPAVNQMAHDVQRFVDCTEDLMDPRSPRNRWIEAKPLIDRLEERLRND